MKQIRAILQRIWITIRKAISLSAIVISNLYSRLKKLLAYMAGEVRQHLPGWKQDARAYREEQRDRWTKFRKLINLSWMDWRRTFANLDASPEKLHEMLFEDKTKIGRRFEELLIVIIIGSVIVVLLDSVPEIHSSMGFLLDSLEWIFTIIFTIEYLLRIYSSPHPIRYMTSFFGIIDLITVLPTYIAIFVPQAHTFLILRVLRVFRVFRLLKLVKMMQAGQAIQTALQASKAKIAVFLVFVILLVTLLGSVLYIVEAGQDSGFTSIPNAIYWAIITLTTVGYGDITPVTSLGKMIAAAVMLVGYSIIAVPTGIVTAQVLKESSLRKQRLIECRRCGQNEHLPNARYCNRCGDRIEQPSDSSPGSVMAPV
ncbi:MAG: ion transporter [Saprospiraceae bacterium]|nr:ion transporter [Saprospiraceae bacterium]